MPICTTKCESCGDIVHHGWVAGSWLEVGMKLPHEISWLGSRVCDKCKSQTMRITDLERTEKDGPPLKESKCATVLMSKEKQREACAKIQGEFSKKLMNDHYGIK